MGNNQAQPHKRDRAPDGGSRSRAVPHLPPSVSTDDGCPVQMRIAQDNFDPSADLLDSNEYPVVFKWSTQHHPARVVHLAGSWDQWKSKIPLVKSTNDFSTIINLNPGDYEYKFLVDGKWMVDSQANKSERNGDMCNVMNIDEADFEVFNALDKDMEASNAGVAMKKMNSTGVQQPSHDTPNDREIEKLREFTQQLPDRRDFEKAPNPPVLPPHLLQVILNKDTPVSCDPNVLPEPNHVMLNHLYALSIKDGVMVLSATHRHRKKYVTTLLYKPI
ncbi:unnamed protein product [Bursaphelenchus xylophilus]|uniref:5'-AMP-activated protein kinase subunit beta-1 n=1 Tax=Bursaphelenchus xylophilus TaxID=6326 RepID=A0A1I7RKP7_BURXY|nr:unnamed protein product [Bursaphelenchus xylophilus]CAG9131176.1 unnamed protein product [Bursaphelenchus xylophilus]